METIKLNTFEASVKVSIKATSKMDAARKIRVMFLSSSIGPRDYEISDFEVIEHEN